MLTAFAGSPVAIGILIGILGAAALAAGTMSAAMIASRIVVVGAWLVMSTQALIHGARMAGAWLLAMGPIGWVIGAVLGLAAIIWANWDNISKWTREMWEKHVKPVFDNLSTFITKDVPKAFEQGVKWIGEAWGKLQDLAKAPVKFVVDTVINKGLIDGLNGIGNFLNLPDIPHVQLPAGFYRGGILPGQSSWRDGDDQLVPMRRGEGVYVSEVMRDPLERARLYAMNKAAIAGQSIARVRAMFGEGYAKGGLVHPLRASTVSQPFHGGHNGIDFAAPTGTPIVAAGPGRVSSAGWSAHGGGNEIHIDHPNGLQTWYAHLSRFAVSMGDVVRGGQRIGDVGSTGNSTGPHLHYMVFNGGWPNFVNPSPYLDGGGEAGKGGWNPIAAIVDGLVDSFKAAFPAAGFIADIAIGAGKKLLDGAVDFVTGNGGKDDGIGSTGLPYLHDNGGVLNPGLSSIMNATRKPEAILTAQQWSDISTLAARGGGAGGGFTNYGPIHVRDENEMARSLLNMQRDAQAVYA
ncbi:M23 family metallopeptidase [Pseudarthrobacter sp. NamE5]|nr:M23 family metallopeptidase [Pseudarthrobacter sp. NamE5]